MESRVSKENTPLSPLAGQKRPASLLPAFEPLSSSPSLPRPAKRFASDAFNENASYPTPVPTSSTAILASSPPKYAGAARSSFPRAHSTFSERAPLSAVPTIVLDANGEPILMGRSSASCQYQLSSSRLISRVHVQATFKSGSLTERDRVEILCSGWNGIKIHCQGKTYELRKGKTFSSDIRDADILIDVQDIRVLVRWPESDKKGSAASSDTWDEEASPIRHRASAQRLSTLMSPLRERDNRLVSPESPTPATRTAPLSSSPFLPTNVISQNPVKVYEDEPSPSRPKPAEDSTFISQLTELASQSARRDLQESFISNATEDFSDDGDEENDPIVHSFGPFGHNLLPRLQAFTAGGGSPKLPNARHASFQNSATPTPRPMSPKKYEEPEHEEVRNHVVNQLAFSRLSSTPFSTILNHLPKDLQPANTEDCKALTRDEIRGVIDTTLCIGKVARAGKDAAGQPLESEYYYIPEDDTDVQRKEAVVNELRKPGLRACRKQHKQYYWRKPK